jgi:hypothetical protein
LYEQVAQSSIRADADNGSAHTTEVVSKSRNDHCGTAPSLQAIGWSSGVPDCAPGSQRYVYRIHITLLAPGNQDFFG